MSEPNGRVRRHVVTECGGGLQGKRCADALERAMVHNGVEHLAPDNASRLAVACWLAEDDAVTVLTNLIDRMTELRALIKEPGDTAPDEDSRSWNCDVSAGDMDDAVHAMRALTMARRAARPAR
jgi:hypothetical protein